MNFLTSLILGAIEGFTEFLPISSTAHLILASEILRISQSDFLKTFEIVIQGGAILAVLVFYWKKFLDIEVWKKLIVAFIPTAIVGLLLYKIIKNYLLASVPVVLWALALGGIAIIVFELYFKSKPQEGLIDDWKDMSYKKAALIGLIQSLAVIPGVSRSAATIIGGMSLSLTRRAIVEFSFLLAVPTILAASGLDLVKNLGSLGSGGGVGYLAVGFVVAFITALLGIKFLLKLVQNKSFIGFGIYRIALVIVFLIFFRF